ncbi:MAG: YjgN family protein [Longimicrobiales bacterium]
MGAHAVDGNHYDIVTIDTLPGEEEIVTKHESEQDAAGATGSLTRSDGVPGARHTPLRLVPQFSGRAGEYFGIWLVNVLLSIITLGIYSAWAKVRTEQYFYANTRLAGASFQYLASPLSILKGRLIAIAIVATLVLSAQFLPLVYAMLALGLALSWPALVVLALRFRARNSAWRGLRFRFTGDVGDAYGPFLGWRILTGLTMTLAYPAMKRRQHEFLVEGHAFGQHAFRFHGITGKYFKPYLIALAFGVVALSGIGLVAVLVAAGAESGPAAEAAGLALFAVMAVVYPGAFVMAIMLSVRYHNLLWNNTTMGQHRFEATMRVRDMLWLYFSNAVAMLFTLGLATPWATTRLARYRAAHFAVLPGGSLDEFIALADGEHSAAGAELVDALDTGVDLEFGM